MDAVTPSCAGLPDALHCAARAHCFSARARGKRKCWKEAAECEAQLTAEIASLSKQLRLATKAQLAAEADCARRLATADELRVKQDRKRRELYEQKKRAVADRREARAAAVNAETRLQCLEEEAKISAELLLLCAEDRDQQRSGQLQTRQSWMLSGCRGSCAV